MQTPPPGFSPYAPPAAPAAPPVAGALPGAAVALYTPGHVALATFFGTPMGGAVLMAINERRLGRGQAAMTTAALGLVGTAALIGLAFLLPDNFPSAPLGIGSILAMRAIAHSRFHLLVQAHRDAGGKIASGWSAFGIGLLCLVAVMVPVFVVAFAVAFATG